MCVRERERPRGERVGEREKGGGSEGRDTERIKAKILKYYWVGKLLIYVIRVYVPYNQSFMRVSLFGGL